MKYLLSFLVILTIGFTSCMNDSTETVNVEEPKTDPRLAKKIEKPDNVAFTHKVLKSEENDGRHEIEVYLSIAGTEHLITKEGTPGLQLNETMSTETKFINVLAKASTWWAGAGSNYFAIWDQKNNSITVKRELLDEMMEEDAEPMIEDLKTIPLEK